jgi:hypothetical protein
MRRNCFLIAFMAAFLCSAIAAGQTTPVDSQNTDNTAAGQDTTGIWVFEKAEFKAYKYKTETVVETVTIDNTAALDTAGFHFNNVFREIEISGNRIVVVLGTRYRNSLYRLEGDRLIALENDEKEKNDNHGESEELPSMISLPPFVYSRTGGKMQFTFKYPYGDSRYNFSLEGRLSVTYIKSKPN